MPVFRSFLYRDFLCTSDCIKCEAGWSGLALPAKGLSLQTSFNGLYIIELILYYGRIWAYEVLDEYCCRHWLIIHLRRKEKYYIYCYNSLQILIF